MLIFISIIAGFFAIGFFALLYLFYRLYKKFIDLENFVLSLNESINEFKNNIDIITKSNILIYDDNVFEIMTLCKKLKVSIDSYLKKFDYYKNYIYTEDVVIDEPKETIGLIRSDGTATRLN